MHTIMAFCSQVLLITVLIHICVQALRNLVNISRQRIQQLFNDLDRRLKSLDMKDQLRAKGEGRGAVQKPKAKTTAAGDHAGYT